MAKRIVPVYVDEEYVKGDNVEIGASGSHNDVALLLSFSDSWRDLAKKTFWQDANGENPSVINLTAANRDPGFLDQYIVDVPHQIKAVPGICSMIVKGFRLVDGEETEVKVSEEAHFRLLKGKYDDFGSPDLTPSEADQLQAAIEAVDGSIPDRIDAAIAPKIAAHNVSPYAHPDMREQIAFNAEATESNSERIFAHAHDSTNPHMVTAEQAGADPAGAAASALTDAKRYTDERAATAEKWATVAVKEAIPDITDEATFRTYFYNLRKSQSRKYQFEIPENGTHENIVTGVGGRPAGVSAKDKAFLYIDLPYSEAGGFIISATYELRLKPGIWRKTIHGTLNAAWEDSGWYEPAVGGGADEVSIGTPPTVAPDGLKLNVNPDAEDVEIPTMEDFNRLDESLGYVTPEMFGAKGDGSTDDTDAIVAAFAGAKENGKAVKGVGTYKTSRTVLASADCDFNAVTYTGAGVAFEVNDSEIVISVKFLTSNGGGILIDNKGAFAEHITSRIGIIASKTFGIKYTASASGIQHCVNWISGSVRGDAEGAVVMNTTSTDAWIGEIKCVGGEVRSESGYGVFASAVGEQKITAIRFVATSLEQCKLGVYLKNAILVDFIGCRREKAGKVKFAGYCRNVTFSGYRTSLDDVDVSEFVNRTKGESPSIRFNEPVAPAGTPYLTCSNAYMGRDSRMYVTPNPRREWLSGKGTASEPLEPIVFGGLLTSAHLEADAHLKMPIYYGYEGISTIQLSCAGAAHIYSSTGVKVLDITEKGEYLLADYGQGWKALKFT